MNWNATFGIICLISLLIPLAVIIYNRFYHNFSLFALGVYFLMKFTVVLFSIGLIPVDPEFRTTYSTVNNYLDVPLILLSLLFFCTGKQKKKPLMFVLAIFVAYELVITLIQGFDQDAHIYIVGPGRLIILLYTSMLFARQVKFSIFHRKNQGRMIMLGAILFGYGCYLLTFYFKYILETPYQSDVLLLYFISSSIAAMGMAVGLHLTRKRMKELQALKITRKELAVFFGH
jgi:hypothetical protein